MIRFATVGSYAFSALDVARVRRGIEKARCRSCTPYARAYAASWVNRKLPPKPGCQECAKAQARLRVLEAYLKEREEL